MSTTLQELENRAKTVLHTSPIHELRTLNVERVENTLCIQGNVSTYYHKQLAQEMLRRVCCEARLAVKNLTHVAPF